MDSIVNSFSMSYVLDQTNIIFFGETLPTNTLSHAKEQWAFKEKLSTPTRDRKTKQMGECPDIDATTFVTKRECQALLTEAKTLAVSASAS